MPHLTTTGAAASGWSCSSAARSAAGSAPVNDPCGVAGGVYQWQPAAGAGGDYQQTVNVRRGDMGSKLPPMPTDTQ